MLSGDETLDADWLRRAVDGGISHRQYGGQEQMGRGPLIVVRDESGSMAGAPHAMAVALEWALPEIAQRDNRPFYSVPFSGRINMTCGTPMALTCSRWPITCPTSTMAARNPTVRSSKRARS